MNKEITNLKIENLKEFKGHPFKVVDDWDMVALTESIRKSGIINPVVVRPIEGTENYEIISGHRRIFAAKKAGLSEVPALIYSMDKDAAIVAVVDSNFSRELIDHIEVHETQGEGKHKTQRIVIFYRFVGYIEIPEMALNQGVTKDTRQGVAVSYTKGDNSITKKGAGNPALNTNVHKKDCS